MEIRALAREETSSVATTLALAFMRDPLFCELLPRDEERRKWLYWFHLKAIRESRAVGGAYTVGGPEGGAILLVPPGRWPPPLTATILGTSLPPTVPPWRFVRAGLHLEHRIHRLHPDEPHVYVYVLGVHPSQQGRGLGGRLLRHAASIASAAGVVSHLETSNPENLTLYRHFGYEIVTEITSHRAKPVWTMRTARPEPRG